MDPFAFVLFVLAGLAFLPWTFDHPELRLLRIGLVLLTVGFIFQFTTLLDTRINF